VKGFRGADLEGLRESADEAGSYWEPLFENGLSVVDLIGTSVTM
jgi:hypothetical protein